MTARPPLRVFSAVLWASFLFAIIAIMVLLLRACGVTLPGFGAWHAIGFAYCARPAAAIDDPSRTLTQIARQLELRLLQEKAICLAQRVDPPAPGDRPSPAPPPVARPEPQQAPNTLEAPELKLPREPGNDLAFLAGCWRTDPFRHLPDGAPGVSTYCFGADGKGWLEFTRDSTPDYVCRTSARASFEGEGLSIRDSDTRCSNGETWHADSLDCRRGAGDVADCTGQSSTPSGPHRWTVRLTKTR